MAGDGIVGLWYRYVPRLVPGTVFRRWAGQERLRRLAFLHRLRGPGWQKNRLPRPKAKQKHPQQETKTDRHQPKHSPPAQLNAKGSGLFGFD
jgi:hypothetical protein